MAPRLPDGDPAPADGVLPDAARAELRDAPLGVYVHVPFCATRCGYCDFNTYTAAELRDDPSRSAYAAAAIAELALARGVLGEARPAVSTVFFGGGTPTLLGAGELGAILEAIDAKLGMASDAEVTVEANPETVDPRSLEALRARGFTRISLGMQSASPHVLAVLDRVHTPGRPVAAAREARQAGFGHVNLDVIYGTPGETDDDWRATIDAVLAAGPDHVSAYALTVEPGTAMHARVRRGELAAPDDDAMARRYRLADALLQDAGLHWYELSNWATERNARSRHNLLYWRGGNWWGVGPGAHSHVGGVRWWNVLHPAQYVRRLQAGESPAQGREVLDRAARRFERVMLESRLAEGLDAAVLGIHARREAERLAAEGLIEAGSFAAGRVVLTLEGRLLADAVARALSD
jgi:putative oxygen-independent coproporphyrinogen III oxidase